MKITVINGSPRLNGNTMTMIKEFCRGAEEAGHSTEVVNVAKMNIKGCLGCGYCMKSDGVCVQKDDMAQVMSAFDDADMVVFAAPIYWFDITAQLKTVIDRIYAKGKVGFNFNKVALLLDAAGDGVFDAAISRYKMSAAYLKWEDKGVITVPGMHTIDSMKTSPKLEEVYNFAKSL